jgi:purine-binding chemotaxis protein CheW
VRVGRETYALPVVHVAEVAELGELSPVPGAPPAALGVLNLRGAVLPVFDLAALFGVAADGRPLRLIVAEDPGRRAGLAVDAVTDVAELGDLAEADSELLAGSALDGGELVGVVDVTRLLDAIAGGTG